MAFFTGFGMPIQSQNRSEINRLNRIGKEIDEEVTKVLIDTGYAYYERHKNDTEFEDPDNMRKLKGMFDELNRINAEIKRLQGYRSCPSCNAEVAPDAMFCASCGANVPLAFIGQNPQPSAGAGFCPNCGNALSHGDAFCNNCGTKIG
ncbi:MAG: zinc ribbon domain-containing protein [Ruminococcaceae bacterium]|nr:zinc ribbon domain-containing protein [Oscillospiraceae bacterium]